ncbi:MAG: fibronectin type III domain-containing protein [Candidatus Levyibacteriota bacterium]
MKYAFAFIIPLILVLVGTTIFLPQVALADDCAQITQAPNLYQATQSGSNARLYFTPVNEQTTGYTINYGLSSGDDRYSVDFANGDSTGAISYTVGGLDPTFHYFFRVRAKNACSTGPYGSWVATIPGTFVLDGSDASASAGTLSPAPTNPPAVTPTNTPTIKTPVTGVSSALVMGLVSLGLCGGGVALLIGNKKKISL